MHWPWQPPHSRLDAGTDAEYKTAARTEVTSGYTDLSLKKNKTEIPVLKEKART